MDIFSEAIAFGITPFETVYFENNSPQRLQSHYKRLKRASNVFCSNFSETFDEFENHIKLFINSSNKDTGVLKIILLDRKLNFKIRDASYNKDIFREGISLCISKTRNDKSNIFTYFKTLNYGKNVLEDKRAKQKGYNSCLLLNNNNEICETAYANIFFRKGKTVYTPHLRCGILPGVMRKGILEFSRANNYEVKKEKLCIEDIKFMDEAFISSSVSSAFPVKSIGGIKFSSRDFIEFIKEENKFKRPWNN